PHAHHPVPPPFPTRRSSDLADPVLKALFTERKSTHVDHLTWLTAESFGGPDRFTSNLGFQYIIDVHRHLKITDEQRERFVRLYLDRKSTRLNSSHRTISYAV